MTREVFVLTVEDTDNIEFTILGVFNDYDTAEEFKKDWIRDSFQIEDELPDDELEDTLPGDVYLKIDRQEIIE